MHHIQAFLDGDDESFDYVLFSSNNSLFCWFFYETFDAHELNGGPSGTGTERTYSSNDLQTCRSRLVYYFDESMTDIRRYVSEYRIEKKVVEDEEEYALKFFEREDTCDPIDVGLTVGYILKFLDKLVDLDRPIKLTFN